MPHALSHFVNGNFKSMILGHYYVVPYVQGKLSLS
jgi:hypothetical protein